MGYDPAQPSAPPSAPPMSAPAYPGVPPGYPPIVAPGAPVMQQPVPAQQQHYPTPPPPQQQQQQQQQPGVMHPSALPAMRPPAVHVVEQHTYVHLPAHDEPFITHSSCNLPRQITCPVCFSAGPTVVSRQSGYCTYLSCFALWFVCCPLAFIPFCMDAGKDIVHRCSHCQTEVARVRPCM